MVVSGKKNHVVLALFYPSDNHQIVIVSFWFEACVFEESFGKRYCINRTLAGKVQNLDFKITRKTLKAKIINGIIQTREKISVLTAKTNVCHGWLQQKYGLYTFLQAIPHSQTKGKLIWFIVVFVQSDRDRHRWRQADKINFSTDEGLAT